MLGAAPDVLEPFPEPVLPGVLGETGPDAIAMPVVVDIARTARIVTTDGHAVAEACVSFHPLFAVQTSRSGEVSCPCRDILMLA